MAKASTVHENVPEDVSRRLDQPLAAMAAACDGPVERADLINTAVQQFCLHRTYDSLRMVRDYKARHLDPTWARATTAPASA